MTLVNLMKEKVLRKKVFFTLFVLAIASALTQIPVYGISDNYMNALFSSTSVLSFVDALSGGSFSNMSVAGFGITSYITASIIIQLVAVLFPRIENVRRDGEQGRKLMEKITFAIAIMFTIISGTLLAINFSRNNMFVSTSPLYIVVAVLSWIAGSFIIVFLGQKVEDYGIGNGITMILGCNILSRIPNNIIDYCQSSTTGKELWQGILYIAGLVVAMYLFFLIAVYLQTGVLNIPVKQTRKKASVVNTDGYLPISVNIANVLPVIYASSIISMPSLIITLFNIQTNETVDKILAVLSSSNWYSPTTWYHPFGLALYIILLVSFGFFSSSLSFSPDEIADSMKKNGNVIPDINPGQDTVRFLEKRRKVMSAINVVFLIVIAVIPDLVCSLLGIQNFTFLGTSLIIIISMLFDTALRTRAASIHNDKQFRLFGKI